MMMMMMMMTMMMMLMLMTDDYYFGFVVASEYHFRIMRQESISNALQQSGGLKQLWAFTGQPPPKPGKVISGSVDNATKKKVTNAIYYSPPALCSCGNQFLQRWSHLLNP